MLKLDINHQESYVYIKMQGGTDAQVLLNGKELVCIAYLLGL